MFLTAFCVSTWQDTLFCESESKVEDFFTAEEAFLQVDFDVMLDQALQNLVQSSDVFWVSGRLYQQVINIHDYIGKSIDHSFHQALKTGWASQQTHGTGDPLELAHTRHNEGCVWAGPGMQNYLPETGGEVNGTKNSTARSANFANALTYVIHRVIVCVGLIIQCTKVLH